MWTALRKLLKAASQLSKLANPIFYPVVIDQENPKILGLEMAQMALKISTIQ